MKKISLALLLCGGCASTNPPAELVAARAEYSRVAQGPAAQIEPNKVASAHHALADAQRSFADDGDSAETRDLAYIALRKSQEAEAQADLTMARQARENAEAQRRAISAHAMAGAQERVTDAERRADQARQDADEQRRTLRETERRLHEELQHVGKISEEARGLVITLNGSVLFASNRSELLPSARGRLNDVARALQQDPERNIRVEGHTDSTGSTEHNVDLSQRRADSVRVYLVSRGVDPNRIDATGVGSAHPIADNKSAEGRANNRRVEIILEPRRGQQQQQQQQQQEPQQQQQP